MEFFFRELTKADLPFQEEMLYQSIYVPEDKDVYPKDIIYNPLIFKYLKNWGREGDFGLIAESTENHELLGAAWYRFFSENDKAFGYVDSSTPELSIAVLYEHRNKGIGTKLMINLINHAKNVGIKQLSLSVIPENTAVNLYKRLGFETVNSALPHLVMKLDL
ncbi:MAG TPA: GNAT family N-acetyltransferase [Cytophagales bacterium]|nr:GNAT family N-acetyltransferase [Cytophagales bacterium]